MRIGMAEARFLVRSVKLAPGGDVLILDLRNVALEKEPEPLQVRFHVARLLAEGDAPICILEAEKRLGGSAVESGAALVVHEIDILGEHHLCGGTGEIEPTGAHGFDLALTLLLAHICAKVRKLRLLTRRLDVYHTPGAAVLSIKKFFACLEGVVFHFTFSLS